MRRTSFYFSLPAVQSIILETAVERGKDVHSEDEKSVVTCWEMSLFSVSLGASRACADFRESTADSRIITGDSSCLEKTCIFSLLLACCLPLAAQAISTEGAELMNTLISPFDKPAKNPQMGTFDGVSIQFKATSLPSGGNTNHTYEWGFTLGTDGAETKCGAQTVFAAFRSDGQGNRKFVVPGLTNRNTCQSMPEIKNFSRKENQWYELRVSRDNYITERISLWTISVINLNDTSTAQNVSYTVSSKNSINSATLVRRLRGSQCSDSNWRVEWRKPAGILNDQ